ncbi:MAG: hypothetical protein C4278_01240 [Patescibacteria group bacterium]
MPEPTYSLIKVKDVKDNVYIMENGGLRAVLGVPGVNFELMNEEDQKIMLNKFKALLDGLDFNLEIFVLSRYENLDGYFRILHERLKEEKNELIRYQLEEYIAFLEDYLNNNKVMKKLFFVVVPYDEVSGELPLQIGQKLPSLSYEEKLFQLETRINYVYEILSSAGLMPIRLNNFELLWLLFEVFNPNLRWGQVPKQILEKLSEFLQ